MQIKAFLNPNPKLEKAILTNVWGEEFTLRNEPHLEVQLQNAPPGEYSIQIVDPIRIEKEIRVSSKNISTFFVHSRFENVSMSSIAVRVTSQLQSNEYVLPLSINTISGKVVDFNDRPLSAYLWDCHTGKVDNHGIVAKADNEGNFTLLYPQGKKLRLFVCDETYGKTSLESWIMSNELKTDVVVNPHIGNFELYGFHSWYSSGIWHVFFIPSKIEDVNNPPNLEKSDIRIWIGGSEEEVKTITRHDEPMGNSVFCPSYLLSIEPKETKEIMSPFVIHAQLNSHVKGRGEAFFVY